MQQIDKERLATAANMDKDIEFVWQKEIRITDLVLSAIWLEMGVYGIQVPVSQRSIAKLKESSDKKICYDEGSKRICDSSRSSTSSVSTPKIIEQMVFSHLNLPGAEVHLQKVIIYGDGCHYERNFNSKKCGKIGTVILLVPVEGSHKGGVLSLAYNGKVKSLNASNLEVFNIACFYDFAEKLMEPVTEGVKLEIQFEITWSSPKMTVIKNFPSFITGLQDIQEALKTWNPLETVKPRENDQDRRMSTELKEDLLFFILKEKYEKKKLSFGTLRGQDKMLVDVLMHCDFLELHLAAFSSCAGKNKKQDEETSVKTSRWIDSGDTTRNLKVSLSLDEHCVGPKKNLSNGTHSILVIWPKENTIQIYGRHGGLRALLIRLEKFKNSNSRSSQRSNVKYLRRVMLFCCSEPRRVWTQSCMEKGELTLSLLRLCITFRAHEEGLMLLNSIGSFFENQEADDDNYEGIQNEEVALAIADFEHCVTGWDNIKAAIKPFISPDRLSKQLTAVMKLAIFFSNNGCVEGAKMVGYGVAKFFANIDPSEVEGITISEIENFISMFVTLKSSREISCKKMEKLFVDFSCKLDLIFLCRLILDVEARIRSKTSFQSQKICSQLCEMLSFRLNTTGKTSSTELLCDIHLILSSPVICLQLTSSDQGRQSMISMIDWQLKVLKSREESGLAPPAAENPIKMVSTCIQCYMQTELKTHLENPMRLSLIFALLPKFPLEELVQILTMKYSPGGSEKPLFVEKLCESILSRMKEKTTVMPSRELVITTVKLFLKFRKSLTRSLLMQVCTNEISGSWDHHNKLELMENFIADIWQELDQDSKFLIINTSYDLLIVWTSDISGKISSSTNIKEIKIVECIKFFFMVEKNRIWMVRSIAEQFFNQLLSKLSTFQLMEISLAILSEEERLNIKDFPTCFTFVQEMLRLLISKVDFLSLLNLTIASEILNVLLWLNDEECWQKLASKICEWMPSAESDSFIQAALLIQQSLSESPFAIVAFVRILDCWIATSQSWKDQPFTWRQPFAMLRDYPEVEAYLRSPTEILTYASFTCIREAHFFSKMLEDRGPRNGFSVEMVVDGKGRHAFCQISKNGCYHRTVMQEITLMHQKLEDVKKLRQHLVEQNQEGEADRLHNENLATSSDSSSTEEECTIIPTPKRVKRDIPLIDVGADETESTSAVPARITQPDTPIESPIASAVQIGTDATGDSSVEASSQSEANTKRHSMPSNGVSSSTRDSRRYSGYVGSRDERDWDSRESRHCFQCNRGGHMCICPRGFTNRGRGRGVHSRNDFPHNQEGHASSNFPNAGRGRGFIRPTYTHTHPCYKCNQEGHASCVCPSSSAGRGKQSGHFYF